MKSGQTKTTTLNALADVAQRTKGARPIPVQEGSKWKAGIAAILLAQDGIVFLRAIGSDGDRIRYQDIAAADILEDVDQRYTIKIHFRDDKAPDASLMLHDTVFFMVVFAALTSSGISCHFGFTADRLRTLGAK